MAHAKEHEHCLICQLKDIECEKWCMEALQLFFAMSSVIEFHTDTNNVLGSFMVND